MKNMEKEVILHYNASRKAIQARLKDFRNLPEKDYFYEHLFCLLTPQSNAKKCWEAVEQLKKGIPKTDKQIASILKSKTRFHNNKAKYVLQATKNWNQTKQLLNNSNTGELRDTLAKNIKGYGLKEAGHFLRNIGKSNNKVAILDRHILRNLVALQVIDSDKIKNDNHYKEIEQKYLQFAQQAGIPADELDLVFWSKENGDIFK
ncbi:MAG: DNA lyase [archaeon]